MSSDDHGPLVLSPDMLQARVRLVDVADLEDWVGPYEGDVGAAHTHLGAFGQLQLPVVSDGAVVYGQEFVAAERVDGQYGGRMAVLDLTDLDWPREKIIAAVLGLDRLKALQAVDAEQLLGLLQEVRKADEAWLTGAGYDGDDLDAIYEQLQRDQEALDAMAGEAGRLADGVDADDVPDSAPAIAKPGDVWIIGPHRVVAGDSTDTAVLDLLLAGHQADMVWTDPPYGVEIVGGNHSLSPEKRKAAGGKTIQNDAIDEEALGVLLNAAFDGAAARCRPGAAWFIAAPPGPLFGAFAAPLKRLGIWRQTLVWEKDSLVMGRSDYHYRHEAIFYGWVPGAAHTEPPDRTQDTVWEIPRPKRSEDHPTMKPVELVARAIRNHTKLGATILDPFGGSGTTLVAAHQEGRAARLVELDPLYVDVICKRAQLATGIKPILESTGEAHDFTGGDV